MPLSVLTASTSKPNDCAPCSMLISDANKWEAAVCLTWFDRHRKRGLISIILRQLQCKVGELEEVEAQVYSLEVAQSEELSEALLDFELMGDLTAWLRNLERREEG